MTAKLTKPSKIGRRRSSIRRSTDADLRAIHAWLVDQNARNVPGTFLCNWRLTEACHRDGELLIYVDGESGDPVAYQWGGLVRPGILEVRHDMRGKGIGRKLVARRIAQAYERDQCLLVIQCTPSSSIPFWKRMGFTVFNSGDGHNYAYRILEKKHELPSDAIPVSVAIRFFPKEREWKDDVPALSAAEPCAVRTSDGVVHLSERVFFLSAIHHNAGNPVVEIEIGGQLIYRSKAKYEEAQRIGVHSCTNGFYIDQISPQTSSNDSDP